MTATTEQLPVPYSFNAEQIISNLMGAALESSWNECLESWEDSDPIKRAGCRAHVVGLRDNFIDTLRDVDDAYEQENITSIFYTQVKTHWILSNTQSGYQIQNGRFEGGLFCRSGMLSALLGVLEPLIRKSDVNRITNFLAEPKSDTDGVNPDADQLANLIGVKVRFEESSMDGLPSDQVVVDAKSLENRFRQILAQLELSESRWKNLQAELDVSDPGDVAGLLKKLQSSIDAHEATNSDTSDANSLSSEWIEKRELQLGSFRKEVGVLRAGWEQVSIETGLTDAPTLINGWRNMNDLLHQLRSELATKDATLAALYAEYGKDLSPSEIIGEMRRLSSKLMHVETQWEKLHSECEYLGREFGAFDAQQMVELIRDLKDKTTVLSAQSNMANVEKERLIQEFGSAEIETIVSQMRELRDSVAVITSEILPLRAHHEILQNELGKTDARELTAYVRALETRIQGYSEMSQLLGNMEQALRTMD